MSIQDRKIGRVRNKLEGWPCPFCGSFTYYVIVLYEARIENGGLVARCSKCRRLRGIVMETQSFWVKPRTLACNKSK